MTDSVRFLIIGAGPTGLGAARRLQQLGQEDVLILEQSPRVGGLSTSVRDDAGFTWDIGGHVVFSHYPFFDQILADTLSEADWLRHDRSAWARLGGNWVPYPVQSNLRHMPLCEKWKSVAGIVQASLQSDSKPAHFEQWLRASFGGGLASVFMIPYNRKVWAQPLDQMSYGWIGERVAKVSVTSTLRNVLMGKDSTKWGPNNTFMFPREGGTGKIWNRLHELIGKQKVRFNAGVNKINTVDKIVETTDGRSILYEHLLSTMALDLLVTLLQPAASADLLSAAARLQHSSVHVVGVGFRGKPPASIRDKCWMYFPENNCPFYRVTVFSNYSPNNVPDPATQWSLLAETSESPTKPVNASTIVEDTIQGFLNTGLVSRREDVVHQWHHRADRAYPTPSLGRDPALEVLLPYLESVGIQSRGRFGLWRYELGNQDHSAMQGGEWADRMVSGARETLAGFPKA